MKRYALIGVHHDGTVLILKTGRGDGPDHLIREVIEHSTYHGHPYKTILLVQIGYAEDVSGTRLNLGFDEVNIVPPPTYTLSPAEKRR